MNIMIRRKILDFLRTRRKKGCRVIYWKGRCPVLVVALAVSFMGSVFFPLAQADSPLYPIIGYATSCDGAPAYQGAHVTVMNPKTGVVYYDTTEQDGYFGITFSNMMGTREWEDGDTLVVWINGTGSYAEWEGKQVTIFDEDLIPHQINVTLCPPDTAPPPPPENLHATQGYVMGRYWIYLEWDPPTGMGQDSPVTYRIYRGNTSAITLYPGSTTGHLGYNDTNLHGDTTYYYAVTTVTTTGESDPSPMVNITTRLPPHAQFSIYPSSPRLNESITFLDSSTDPDGMITNWTWQITPGGTRYGANVSYLFTRPGTYTVTLTVTDTAGDHDTAALTLSLSTLSEGTPGFELLILLFSLASMALLQKKRKLV